MLRYTIQLAAVEFLDDDHYKIRPVVVLTEPAGDYHTVLAAPIYSRLITDMLPSDMVITDPREYGLVRGSMIRLHRITELLKTDLKEQIGSVPEPNRTRLDENLRHMFSLS